MAKSFESTALRALARSDSLRATVPAPVAALLGLEPGDAIVWSVEPGTGVITVSKKRGESPAPKESKRR
jgi:bifunctional DNA-binding transcriptional regulator/antitoxin component of YhaV-PrlF toxin-antitoxin module